MEIIYYAAESQLLKEALIAKNISKKSLSAIKRNGALIVNDHHVTVRHQLCTGDQIKIILPQETPSPALKPCSKPLDITYEDDYLCIVNKPADISTMPSQLHPHESLLECALHHFDGLVPHIVTRLDRQTSGLVVFAKHQLIHHWLTDAIEKTYICAVQHQLPARGTIELPVGRKMNSIIEREVRTDGKYALTSYVTISSSSYSTAVVRLHTGRTHQIRVHFSAIGHPLLGDTLYGKDTSVNRQALHAFQLKFMHPVTHEQIVVQCRPTEDISPLFPML